MNQFLLNVKYVVELLMPVVLLVYNAILIRQLKKINKLEAEIEKLRKESMYYLMDGIGDMMKQFKR